MSVALQEMSGGGNVSGGPGGKDRGCGEAEGQAASGRGSGSRRRGCELDGRGSEGPRPESSVGGREGARTSCRRGPAGQGAPGQGSGRAALSA